METIANALGAASTDLQPRRTSAAVSISPSSERDRRVAIARIIGEVELAKQITLTADQRAQLIHELNSRPYSLERIRQMGESVKLKETYGTLALHHWLEGEVMTRSDVTRLAGEIVRKRREQLERVGVSQGTLERMGLVALNEVAVRRERIVMEQMRTNATKRIRRAEVFVRQASQEVREDLYELAIDRGLIAPDPLLRERPDMYAGRMLEDVERIMRRIEAK